MPGENQAENCQKLIDHLANEVLGEKGMGSKIAHLLQEEEEHQFDKPSLEVPDESMRDDPDCEKQKREMELELEEALSDPRKKKESHEEGKERLASVLCEKCSSHVITKLEAQDDWKKIRFEDPVEILKRIKDIVFDCKGVNNPCDLINGAIKGVNDLRQMENESTKDWASRVKTRVSSLESYWLNIRKHASGSGSDEDTAQLLSILHVDPTSFKEDPMRVQAVEEHLAHIVVTKCCHNTCWEMKKNHSSLHAGGKLDPHPKTVAEAMEMLNDKANKSRHPPPQQPKKQQPNQNKDSNNAH